MTRRQRDTIAGMRKALAALGCSSPHSQQVASANGRDPYSSTIHWQRGAEQNIAAGMTFGLVLSHDGGATWQWMCEKAIGYGGMYDPDYEYTSSGAMFATTFDGLKVMRDGCTFAATPPGMTFVSRIEQDKDGGFYFAASDHDGLQDLQVDERRHDVPRRRRRRARCRTTGGSRSRSRRRMRSAST